MKVPPARWGAASREASLAWFRGDPGCEAKVRRRSSCQGYRYAPAVWLAEGGGLEPAALVARTSARVPRSSCSSFETRLSVCQRAMTARQPTLATDQRQICPAVADLRESAGLPRRVAPWFRSLHGPAGRERGGITVAFSGAREDTCEPTFNLQFSGYYNGCFWSECPCSSPPAAMEAI